MGLRVQATGATTDHLIDEVRCFPLVFYIAFHSNKSSVPIDFLIRTDRESANVLNREPESLARRALLAS